MLTFVYFVLVADWHSHSWPVNHRCEEASWRSLRQIRGWPYIAYLCRLTPQLGLHRWALVGGFLENEIQKSVLRKNAVCSVAGRTYSRGFKEVLHPLPASLQLR